MAYDYAAKAAIERALTSSIEMVCHHFTSWETDEVYAAFRPKGQKSVFFCEQCGKWQPRLIAKPKGITGHDPMF